MNSDFIVENHGSILLLQPLTPEAQGWVEEHIPAEGEDSLRFGTAVVVEPRYIDHIVEGIQGDGLTVRGL